MPQCPSGSSWPAAGGTCEAPGDECSQQKPCPQGFWCDYPDNRCGDGQPGECKPSPNGCDLLYAPVCGCDGTVHGNDCGAMTAGVDINSNGGCMPPQDTFECGHLFCLDGSYCRISISDVGGVPDGYSCELLPMACGSTASCACLANEPCGSFCELDAGGNATLTCPGG